MAWMTTEVEKSVTVESSAFQAEKRIPSKYTCQGPDMSPPISVGDLPDDAKAWAVIVEDPDAPGKTWLHWTAWNLPADPTTLPEDADIRSLGGREGKTDFGDVGYGGPCPPSGTHRYVFRVFALDDELDVEQGADLNTLQTAINDHALAYGELMGTYSKE